MQAKFLAVFLGFGAVTAFGYAHADPLKVSHAGPVGEAPRADMQQAVWAAVPADRAVPSKRGSHQVANAVSAFDLSKLTMADFGDVDSGR